MKSAVLSKPTGDQPFLTAEMMFRFEPEWKISEAEMRDFAGTIADPQNHIYV